MGKRHRLGRSTAPHGCVAAHLALRGCGSKSRERIQVMQKKLWDPQTAAASIIWHSWWWWCRPPAGCQERAQPAQIANSAPQGVSSACMSHTAQLCAIGVQVVIMPTLARRAQLRQVRSVLGARSERHHGRRGSSWYD